MRPGAEDILGILGDSPAHHAQTRQLAMPVLVLLLAAHTCNAQLQVRNWQVDRQQNRNSVVWMQGNTVTLQK